MLKMFWRSFNIMQVLKILGIHKRGELKMLWLLVRLCQMHCKDSLSLTLPIVYLFQEYMQYQRCYSFLGVCVICFVFLFLILFPCKLLFYRGLIFSWSQFVLILLFSSRNDVGVSGKGTAIISATGSSERFFYLFSSSAAEFCFVSSSCITLNLKYWCCNGNVEARV